MFGVGASYCVSSAQLEDWGLAWLWCSYTGYASESSRGLPAVDLDGPPRFRGNWPLPLVIEKMG